MRYLRITSPAVCPIEGFTVLGVSTSRQHEELIGEFGSGNKHAVNVCLRHGLNPMIYCGTKRVEFFTKPEVMGDTTYQRVYCQISNRRPERLSVAVEYGERDWTGIDMALREFVSNAIDVAKTQYPDSHIPRGVLIDIVEELTPRQGKTVVGIPCTPEVEEWYNKLPQKFLHFDEEGRKALKKKQKILPKSESTPPSIFRKGVLVRESGDHPSLFDYNFGEELPIDESRNLSDSAVSETVAKTIAADQKALEEIFRLLPLHQEFYERHLGEYDLYYAVTRDVWEKAWKKVHGDAVVSFGNPFIDGMAREKGHRVVSLHDANWYKAIVRYIPDAISVLDNVNKKGHVYEDLTTEAQATLDQVWADLESVQLTNGKEKPQCRLYEDIMKPDGSETLGHYHMDGIIYVRQDYATHYQTFLEEVVHHVTGAYDCSRSFQDFALKLATKMALSRNEALGKLDGLSITQ